ncbi:MAG TPA: glycosyltransferase family 92 protein [Dyella sp.]|uniref:glycosyltransferase family 92 protein n=1 Tax=Dyella sp. TaxID=1869338 RepID=UPI002D078CBF|nr:glycosyltransferase family 92 protein [Dyella sp.]HTV86124.1 glycosyltransferase family 92 protein [Dyella sp.]
MRCVLAICAVFKDEVAYLREWVEFHQLMGVERFYLYNNNSSDRYLDALQTHIESGAVVLHEWPQHPAQLQVYEHCLKTHGGEADWIAFLDVDEFLFSPKARLLPDVLADYADYPAVGVNWVMFGSGGHKEKPKGGVLENFLRRGDINGGVKYAHLRLPDGSYRSENSHIKSIVQPSKVASCPNPHYMLYKNDARAVDENGRPIDGPFTDTVSVQHLRINHYWSKSEEECRYKFSKGFADGNGSRDWNEYLLHEEVLNSVHDDTVLRVVAQLGTEPPTWPLESFVRNDEGVYHSPLRDRPAHKGIHGTAMRLFDVMQQSTDTSLFSPVLAKEIHGRTAAPQLSPRRANALHALEDIAIGSRVLQLGVGGGVLAQAWIERGCHVDAVEFAPHWARVAAARLREQPNARVFQASLRELELRPEYDLVALDFNNDYAEAWPRGDALREAIAVAARALKPDGVLWLSAGNRMADPGNGTLLTRHQLEAALHSAGLVQIDTHLAFPDAQLPELLIAASALAADCTLRVDELIAQRPLLRDAGQEAAQWARHHEAGTLGQYAPGLLLVARREGVPSPLRAHLLAQVYVDNRVPALNTVTDYLRGGDGIDVVPRPLLPNLHWQTAGFEQVHQAHAYTHDDRSLLVEIRKAIHARRTDRMIALLRQWGALVYAQADDEDKIPPEWLDALPANVFIGTDGGLAFRHGEWRAQQPIEKQIPVYVGLWQIAYEDGLEALLGIASPIQRVTWLCKRLLIDASAEWIGHGRNINESFAREIHEGDCWNRTDRHLKVLPDWLVPPPPSDLYKHWQSQQQLSDVAIKQALGHIERHGTPRILIAVIDPAGDADAVAFTEASLAAQHYAQHRLAVLSGDEDLIPRLNRAIQDSDADWVQVVYAGDMLHPAMLLLLAERAATQAQLGAIYFDEDTHNKGVFEQPIFKPDFNLDMLRSYPYAGRALAFKRERFVALGGLQENYGDLASYDLLFRLLEADGLHAIGHIGEVMHRAALPYAQWLAGEAVKVHSASIVSSHLQRLGIAHTMEPGALPGFNRVLYQHHRQPPVSIIVPTKDQLPILNGLLDSLLSKTTYQNYEVLIVDNNTEEPAALAYLAGIEQLHSTQLRVLRYPHPFNYSAINNFAAAQARGEYLILLNNDTAVLHGDWIEALLNHAQRPEVGIVGAKLHYPDGRIQHGGVVLGLRGPADHPFIGQPMEADGYMHRLRVDQNYTAVTAACLMIRKSVYEQVGGLDEQDFKVSYNDVDLCLKVDKAGYLTVWTPYARLMHLGSVSQTKVDKTAQDAKQKRFQGEQNAMYRKWLPRIARDPAYSINLSIDGMGFELDAQRVKGWQPFSKPLLPRLFCVAADSHGCGHYRIVQPFNSMQRKGLAEGMIAGVHLSPVAMERFQPTSLVLQRQVTDQQIKLLESYRDFSRAFKVFELDDLIQQIPIKSHFHGLMPKDIVKSLRRSLSTVDRFVVSTDALAEQFKGFHADIRVVQNRLPTDWWGNLPASERRVGRKPRVGWGGGSSHRGDLELIADVVRDLADEVEWVFFGMCPDKLRPYIHEFHNGVPIEEYPRKLASLNLDLALAPLENNIFNECKSNLRLLEYGACGFPVIATDIVCYQTDLPVTRVRNRYKDWVDAIRMHLADLDQTARTGDALRDAVHKDWMLSEDKLIEWRTAWLPN